MKITKSIKLVILGLIGLLLPVFITSCNNNSSTHFNEDDSSSDDKEPVNPINYEEIKNNPSGYAGLSNDELISFYKASKKLPDKYMFLHENYKIEFSIDSASSIEEANANSKERVHDERHANSKNIPTSSEVIYEGDTYYVTTVKWDQITESKTFSYTADTICFKSLFVDFVAPVSLKGKEFSMTIKNFAKAQEIIDLYEYTKGARIATFKFITSSIQEDNDKYVYLNYYFEGTYGDWGMNDELRLYLLKYEINKTSGRAIPLEPELINTAQDFNIFTLYD